MKRKSFLLILIVTTSLLTMSFYKVSYINSKQDTTVNWADSVVAALGEDRVYVTDDYFYVVDSIPCYGGGQQRKGLFGKLLKETYIDCTSCKMVNGKPNLSALGFCTSVRIVPRK